MEQREIKFRAKRIDNGDFVEGFYIENTDTARWNGWGWIVVADFEEHPELSGNPIEDLTHTYPVDPETVCQFTGLKDKNGVEIYEGDVVKFFRKKVKGFHCSGGFYEKETNDEFLGKIEFRNGSFSISANCYPFNGTLSDWHTHYDTEKQDSFLKGVRVHEDRIAGEDNAVYENIEVIGSIYENPDLLK